LHDQSAEGRLPTLEEMEREHIERALRETGGHRGNAARLLGISERSLYRKLGEHRMLFGSDRPKS
jgi:DNA-binding NtrC family response regulator